jgi:hypothetical protein
MQSRSNYICFWKYDSSWLWHSDDWIGRCWGLTASGVPVSCRLAWQGSKNSAFVFGRKNALKNCETNNFPEQNFPTRNKNVGVLLEMPLLSRALPFLFLKNQSLWYLTLWRGILLCGHGASLERGCQMVYFPTKNIPIWVNFGGP